jgi:hypothetical protein
MRLLVVSTTMLVLVVGPGQAQAAPRFEVQRLSLAGETLAVVPADLDGDGRLDLVIAYRTGLPPNQKRFLAVFWHQGRTFSTRPEVIPLDPGTSCAFDVADVDDRPGAEILLVTPSGVQARSLGGRKLGATSDLVKADTIYFQPVQGELPRLPLVQEVGPAGSADLLVPTLGALELHRRQGGAYVRAGRLEIDMDARGRGYGRGRGRAGAVTNIQVTYAFPSLTVADSDGDGRKDIIAALEDRLAVYRQTAEYVFASQPTVRRDFSVRTPAEITQMSSGAATTVTDIDRDGLADVIIRKQVARGITSASTTSFIYFGRRGGIYPARPDQVMRSEGISGTEIELHDVTGDGRTDMVVPSVNIGVMAIIRVLTTKSVKVTFQVYPFDARTRRFAQQPAAERQLKFRLSLSGETGVQAADLRGDYNGDRRPDLAFGTDDDELSIFPGSSKPGLFEEDAVEEIVAPAFGTVEAVDLDRKGKSDMLLSYPVTKAHRNEVVILHNRGPW